ncbi:MAG: acetyl/propionyl/methylcrotonyl-CoA carboxylase subunit alpha [Pseudomonadota bacterium]
MSKKTGPFKNLLIANRGEIACRVIRTAQRMGLQAIAVYSEADRDAPHVQMADSSYLLGPAPVAESYLSIDRVIQAARETGAEAIHPGYGFLSENAAFARRCESEGLIFVGPNVEAIELMGDKAQSKRRMIEAGVPCIPGYQGDDQSDETLLAEAAKIGFPLMVKASAGGGGRGMRLVQEKKDLASAIKLARSEAENAFGSGELILELAVTQPRHVEIQVFADTHGHVLHLGERDCSVQRRHQKVIEEAPCPVMTSPLRDAMGQAAVSAARDVDYVGAGTVEFLLDENGEFFFLEMNTRLQVEHPVTEIVTGLDLVELQLNTAMGAPLPLQQSDVELTGHAIEARLYAEDPYQDFLPATGPVDLWQPVSGNGIRIDDGIASGGEVSPYYDPMLAKVIGYGQTRGEARQRLVSALERSALFGVVSNKRFLMDVLDRPDFIEGRATTAFIAENFSETDLAAKPVSAETAAIASILLFEQNRRKSVGFSTGLPDALLNWFGSTPLATPFRFSVLDDVVEVFVKPRSNALYDITIDDQSMEITCRRFADRQATLIVDGHQRVVTFNVPVSVSGDARIQFNFNGETYDLTNTHGLMVSALGAVGEGTVVAPMHGLLLEVAVKVGDVIAKGDRLGVLEAMKMQHELVAEIDGVVAEVYFLQGTQVAADALLMQIDAPDGAKDEA